jgi:hypothetical protein
MSALANRDKARIELVRMLEDDRRLAIKEKNPSASLAATVKLADMLLNQLDEAEERRAQVTQLTHRVVHQVVCPRCRELSPVTDTPPLPEPGAAAPLRHRASGWDDEPGTTDTPDEPAPERAAPGILEVPKLLPTNRHRRRFV